MTASAENHRSLNFAGAPVLVWRWPPCARPEFRMPPALRYRRRKQPLVGCERPRLHRGQRTDGRWQAAGRSGLCGRSLQAGSGLAGATTQRISGLPDVDVPPTSLPFDSVLLRQRLAKPLDASAVDAARWIDELVLAFRVADARAAHRSDHRQPGFRIKAGPDALDDRSARLGADRPRHGRRSDTGIRFTRRSTPARVPPSACETHAPSCHSGPAGLATGFPDR